jgi:hypothetical protein
MDENDLSAKGKNVKLDLDNYILTGSGWVFLKQDERLVKSVEIEQYKNLFQ